MQSFHRYKTFRKLLSILWGNDRKMQLRLQICFSLVIVSSILNLSLPWVLKSIIDGFVVSEFSTVLIWLLLSYGIIWTTIHAMIGLKEMIAYDAFERTVSNFSTEVFQKLLDLPVNYHIKNSTGSIRNSMERAEMSIPDILHGLLFVMIPMGLELLIAIIFLSYFYGLVFAFTLFSLFLTYTLFTYLTTPWIVRAQRDGNKYSKKASSYMTDVLMNIEGVHYQSGQEPVLNQCQKIITKRENGLVRQYKRMCVVGVWQNLISGVALIIMTIVVGYGVMQNKLTIGDFVLFNGYLLQFLIPLNLIGYIFRTIREGLTILEDLMKILATNSEIQDTPVSEVMSQEACNIIFKDVDFKYPTKENLVLNNLSFSIPAGQSVALIGENGSGKSTITKLLCRFYDVEGGQILFQGKDIKDINLSSLRELIGIAPQDVYLLNDTIYKNLVFGHKEILSTDFFERVMHLAKVDQFVNKLSQKYDTAVGERGVKLSGGEKQRIGIARALLRKPRLLILDEATSALDENTECEILRHLLNVNDITKLIITHDWRNITEVDQVLYLKNGNIQANGNHRELLLNCMQYKSAWDRQRAVLS